MQFFSPQRARPVRDAEGLVWRSSAHLAASILFEDKLAFQKLDTVFFGKRVLHGVRLCLESQEIAGVLARIALSDSAARKLVGLRVVPFEHVVTRRFCKRALVAAGILQCTQHPRMHRFLLQTIRAYKSATGMDASILRCIARVARCTERKRCRQMAIVALCSLEHTVNTGEQEGECELFTLLGAHV